MPEDIAPATHDVHGILLAAKQKAGAESSELSPGMVGVSFNDVVASTQDVIAAIDKYGPGLAQVLDVALPANVHAAADIILAIVHVIVTKTKK